MYISGNTFEKRLIDKGRKKKGSVEKTQISPVTIVKLGQNSPPIRVFCYAYAKRSDAATETLWDSRNERVHH